MARNRRASEDWCYNGTFDDEGIRERTRHEIVGWE